MITYQREVWDSNFDIDRIDNPDNNRYDAGIRIPKHLAGTIAFPVYKHRIPNTSMGIIQGYKILIGSVPFQHQRLYDQQPAILVIPMADRGYYGPNNFSQNHPIPSGKLIPALL
jgi:hypothetical protein